jgi:hypothetical protein
MTAVPQRERLIEGTVWRENFLARMEYAVLRVSRRWMLERLMLSG